MSDAHFTCWKHLDVDMKMASCLRTSRLIYVATPEGTKTVGEI